MLAGWADTVRRLVAGLILLLALSVAAAPAAFAHGGSHDGVRQTAQSGTGGPTVATTVTPDHHVHTSMVARHGIPCGDKSGDACPFCCATGACCMFSATLASGPSVTVWLPEISAAYGRGNTRDAAGLRSTPDTRPPRLYA